MSGTIYLFTSLDVFDAIEGNALSEDGRLLAQRPFLNIEQARAKMDRPTLLYRKAYPDGYELVWVDDPATHPGCLEARRLNEAIWEAGRPQREAEHARQMEAAKERYRGRAGEMLTDQELDELSMLPGDPWKGEDEPNDID